jgi:hypothetical protein
MAPGATLLSVLRDLERSRTPVLIRFRDGDEYVVRVISTMHAEAGDNIVAEVLRPVSATGGVPVPAGAFMDFLLGDVTAVVQNGAHVPNFAPEADPPTAPDPAT